MTTLALSIPILFRYDSLGRKVVYGCIMGWYGGKEKGEYDSSGADAAGARC